MTFIATVPPRRAIGETRAAYDTMADVAGFGGVVANVVQAFSLRPSSMRRMIRRWELAMWIGEEPRARREMVAAMVSRLNDCFY